jgi:prophage regulatory protein
VTSSNQPDPFLRLPEVKRLAGFSATSTIYRLMKEGSFPAAVKIGARAIAWPASAVAAWQAGRASARIAANDNGDFTAEERAEFERDLFGPGGLEGWRQREAAKAAA